ncbi:MULTISPECIES: hypothetical protein [Bacillaceae]|uniref:hypothetical protein n=1 Tax=Bacillaceae TaxID=186817 RepID=UPI0007010150|nr:MULTISPECIES: hypothetical protein [Bacillaceae]KQL34971.1 hypothetical protein AN959_11520 [Psychrobacillus sp. FJAT-21963]MDF2065307.1 hypothetical protein [Bacillus sp. Cr_A10]
MAKGKNNTLLLAGIAAGAYAYFSKKENRDKAIVAFNNTKAKVNSFIDAQKHNRSDLTVAGHPDPHNTPDSKMVDEGAMTSVQYYNDEVQNKDKKTPEYNEVSS